MLVSTTTIIEGRPVRDDLGVVTDAVIGVDLDYEVFGQGGSMLMVRASGTAAQLG